MGNFTSTFYIPSESGWTSGNYAMRLEVKQEYNSAANKSTLTVKPMFKGSLGQTVNLIHGTIKTKTGDSAQVTQWDFSTAKTAGGSWYYSAPMDAAWSYMVKSAAQPSPDTRYTFVQFEVTHNNYGTASVSFEVNGVYTTIDANTPSFTGSQTSTLNGDIRSWPLTITADAHCTVTVKKGSTVLTSGSSVSYGDVITVTATASSGYAIKTLTVNGYTIANGSTYWITGPVSGSSIPVAATSEPKGIVYIRRSGAWAGHAVYIRQSGSWERYRAFIYTNGAWQQY